MTTGSIVGFGSFGYCRRSISLPVFSHRIGELRPWRSWATRSDGISWNGSNGQLGVAFQAVTPFGRSVGCGKRCADPPGRSSSFLGFLVCCSTRTILGPLSRGEHVKLTSTRHCFLQHQVLAAVNTSSRLKGFVRV